MTPGWHVHRKIPTHFWNLLDVGAWSGQPDKEIHNEVKLIAYSHHPSPSQNLRFMKLGIPHYFTIVYHILQYLVYEITRCLSWPPSGWSMGWLHWVNPHDKTFRNQKCHHELKTTYGYGSIPIFIPFLVGWTSIYQLFWCEQKGYKVLTHCHIIAGWWWLEPWNFMTFHSSLGMPSPQLTNSLHHFSEG